MKIFIVTSGEYSDYHIDAVFSTEENAKKYAELHPGRFADIEEFDVDEDMALINKIRDEKITIYKISMFKDGKVREVKKESSTLHNYETALKSEYGFWVGHLRFDMKVIAKDEKHAIKIVNEKRVQLIANNEWEAK